MIRFKQRKSAVASLFFCLLLGLKLFFLASPEHEAAIVPVYLWPAVIAAIALLFAGCAFHVPRAAAASLMLTCWFWVVTVVNGDRYLVYNLQFLYGIFATFGLALPLLTLLEEPEKWLARIAAVYALLMTAVAALCLYCWMTGSVIVSPFSNAEISIRGWRMFFFYVYPNELGCALGIGFFCWLLLGFRCKHALCKIACLVLGAVVYLAAIPCVSRTTSIVVSLALGAALLLWLQERLPIKRAVPKAVTAVALAAAVAVFSSSVLLGGVLNLQKLYQERVSGNTAAVEQAVQAPAETVSSLPEGTALWARDMNDSIGSFTGRTAIWKEAVTYLRERPVTLLIGETDSRVARITTSLDGLGAIHVQNIWLEMLLQTGVFGLLLYASIILGALWRAVRHFFNPALEGWKRYLCVVVPMVMLTGMMEIYPGVTGNLMDMMGMFLVGAVLALLPKRRAEDRG